MRSGGGLAIVLGALVGIALAVARRGSEPPRVNPAPSVVSVNRAAPTELTAPPELPAPELPPSSPAADASALSELPVAPDPSAPSGPPPPSAAEPAPALSSASPVPAVSALFPMPAPVAPPTTAKELERAEVRCYDKVPDECERAASAYETGRFGPADSARAEKLRKVALTFLVRGCEKRSPHACFVLASRYETGVGLPANHRKATALLEHARGLCRKKPGPECADGEPR